MSRQIGPMLPPGFLNNDESDDVIGPRPDNQNSEQESNAVIGPNPTNEESEERSKPMIGPNPTNVESEERMKPVIGPALPPDLQPVSHTIGPALPPDLLPASLTADQSEASDDDVIGPMLSEIHKPSPDVTEEFERRVLKMKEKLENKSKPKKPQRESWMTELPSIELSAQLGLGARQFKTNSAPSISETDRESWTTVGGKPKSQTQKRSADYFPEELEKDKAIAKSVRHYNASTRGESLMDMHSKKRKKEEKNEEKQERVPFDRERDLNTKKFDDAQRKTILKKAAKLDSRFSHGGKQYL